MEIIYAYSSLGENNNSITALFYDDGKFKVIEVTPITSVHILRTSIQGTHVYDTHVYDEVLKMIDDFVKDFPQTMFKEVTLEHKIFSIIWKQGGIHSIKIKPYLRDYQINNILND